MTNYNQNPQEQLASGGHCGPAFKVVIDRNFSFGLLGASRFGGGIEVIMTL